MQHTFLRAVFVSFFKQGFVFIAGSYVDKTLGKRLMMGTRVNIAGYGYITRDELDNVKTNYLMM